MFKYLGNKRLLVLLVILIVFVVLMGLTFRERIQLTWPEKFIKDTVSFTQEMIDKPVDAVGNWFADIHQIRVTFQENAILRAKLSQYAITTMELNKAESENKDLKKILGFTERQKEKDEYRYRVAEITAVSSDPYSGAMNINLGSVDGMRENMAVVSADGLIGRISRVADHYSTVQRMIDMGDRSVSATPATKAVSATVQGNENVSFGIIGNSEEDPDHPLQRLLVMSDIDPSDPLKTGDTIITSGVGQVFPKGLVIGTVIARLPGDFGIDDKAIIQPAADFNHLHYVMVVEVPGEG